MTKATIKTAAKTTAKTKIISAAQQIMISKGYGASSVDEIIKKAGVAKGSFYHSFKSKEELTRLVLEDFAVKGTAIIADGPYTDIEDPIERALAFVEYIEIKSKELWAHGCLLGTVSVEVAETNSRVLSTIDELFKGFESGFQRILEPAVKKAKLKGITAKDLSVQLVITIEGGIVLAKAHGDLDYLKNGIFQFRKHLEFLLKG